MANISDRPGYKRIRGKHYWTATPAAVRAGYTPKTVNLSMLTDEVEVSSRCRILNAEMLAWLSGQKERGIVTGPKGSVKWLCEKFEVDEFSPVRTKRAATQAFYARYLKVIKANVGGRVIAQLTGEDVRRWFAQWKEKHGQRSAKACIQTLRRAVKYGCEIGHDPSMRFERMLAAMRFETPPARSDRATAEMAASFIAKANEMDRPMVALAVMIQWEIGLRQKDVIGEWVARNINDQAGGITDGRWRWQWGLTWGDIGADWTLRKPTSKSNGRKVVSVDLKLIPDLLAALQAIPKERRTGPIILDEAAGRPYKASHYQHTFRHIADKAGWPTKVWNMDTRAGAITEASEAGANPHDLMNFAGHTQLSTTQGYIREGSEKSGRVVQIRQAIRGARTET
jgi:hypothetical protein